ncbi:MAG: CRISPR-associated helicase Cas3', partial [Candidatus Omnitrophica bacterium]|nr:CRISPR-associated helicase Cas3' [Candidatus Omnitrophota bacterium]
LRESIAQSIENTKKWILISGFLQRCDHFASWCEEENESFEKVEIECMNISDVENNIKSEIRQKIGISNEQQIWQFSKVKDHINKDLILIAPTGYGKTEFAFLWSVNKKFIYTLPLRSAVNQIYDRSLKIFGNDKVGLLHSDADVYLIEKWGDVGDNIKLYELSKNLSFPVIISTGDQFFPYALKPPGYEKIFSLFSYSNLVIDEIQAYDPKACAIIVKFIEWVKTMGGNFLLMTATMPEFVKKILEEKNIQYEEINIYEEEKQKFEEIVKHKIKIESIENEKRKFEIPDDVLDKVVEEAQNGKRVLFILNTVKQAQKVYEKIKDKNTSIEVFLLHSRFTFEDRKNKEIEIISKKFKNPKPDDEKEGKILITTQVVEASLDIDADVLFTEICPLDALVQRMGRVLRRIGPNFVFVSVNNKKRLYKDNQNKTYEVDFSEPNVYVLVFKDGLEFGDGRVYPKELLKLSIAWLWKKSKKDIKEIDFKENEKKEFFEREFKEIFSESSQKPSKGKRKKDGDNEILKKIIEEDDWVKNLNIQEFEISEYEKYKIVSVFYKSLPDDSSYLRKFYETLEVLSAGYMSDRKKDAERIFREIYDIQIIPENTLNDFINEVEKFDYNRNNFTVFKKDVLSKFVVSIPYLDISEEDWIFYKIQENVIDEEKLKRLKRWVPRIFVSKKHEYDKEKGVINLNKEVKPYFL